MKTHLYSFLFLFCSFSFFEAKAQSQCDYFYLNIVNPTFTTQAEVDAFADQYGHCPNIVIYSLTIGFEEGSEESDITDLSRLANISHVYGNLIIRKNPNLTTLHGLHNISSNSFAGSLRIDNNATLADISALSKITQARYLNIRNNNVLQNLNGLQNITQITGAGSGSGYLYIRSNPQLTNIDALQNLTTVGNYIEIMDNALLPNLNGLSGITSINGNIRIYENAALKSIIGLRNISASGIKALIIENNPELEVCNLANFCTYLANPAATHPRSISQNKTTCLNTNAVTTACATACTAISGTNVVLYSQADIGAFEAVYGLCTNITVNNLTIGYASGGDDSDITDLTPLENIKTITGNLILRRNPNLTTLNGLHNITSFSGDLRIEKCLGLTNITALSGITQARYLNIRDNDQLTNLNGLQNLTQITGSGSGSGYLYIYNNARLNNIDALQNLTFIGNYIEIKINSMLLNLNGLSAITTIGGHLDISTNTALTNLNGLSGVTSINGNITIHDNAALTDISGLKNIPDSSISALTITQNPNLEVCNLPNFCEYLSDLDNTREISGNAPGCEDEADVMDACSNCPTPTNITATDITMDSAVINWTSQGTLFDMEWGVSGFTQGTGEQQSGITETSYILSNLYDGTSYDVYIRQDCDEEQSNWRLYTFSSLSYYCMPTPTVPNSENRGDYIDSFTTTGGANNISNINSGYSPNGYGNFAATHSASQYQGDELTFSVVPGDESFSRGLRIWVDWGKDGVFDYDDIVYTAPALFRETHNGSFEIPDDMPAGDYRMRVFLRFNTLESDPCNSYFWNNLGEVEDYTLTVLTTSCFAPTGITATDITMDSAVINWTSQGALFDMEWGVSGFTQGTGEQQSGITETSYILSNLYDGASYDVYIRQDCNASSNGYSSWRLYTFSLSYYCTPTPTVPSSERDGDYIDSFTTTGGVTDIDNINSGYSPNGYGNFAATHSASQYQGDELTFSVVPGDESFSRGLRIWVDWGKDGVFDYDDIVYTAPALFRETHNGSFEIPNVPAGDYRMRVFLRYNELEPDPCNSGGQSVYGEIEDYTLTVLTAPCLAPTGITATNITADSAVINWTSQGELFDMEWGVSGFTQGTGTSVNGITETSYMLSNLYDITSYDVYIRQDCDASSNGYSNWRLYTFSSLSYYCVPTPTNPSSERDGSYIDSFTTTGGVTNISNINSGYSPNGYGNFAATHSASQYPGGEIAFSAEKIEGGANYPRRLRIWVDWNKNGVFDASEIVYQAPVLLNGTHNGTFEIPDVPAGDYRMRVFLRYNTLEPNPCNLGTLNNFGEVEDYTLTVLPDLSGNCDSFTIWNGDEWSNGTPDATKKAIIEGNLNITEDMEACELLLNSGILTVVSENALTVHGAIVNTQEAENFVVESGASLIQINDVANTGAITVRRNSTPMYRLDTTLWSSPVEGQNLFDFSPGTLTNRFYYYDAVNNIFDHAGLNEDSVFKAATGYGIRSPNNYPASDSGNPAREFEGEFTGVPHNGNYEVDTFLWSEQPYGYNLVGNPYPSALDATMFTAANADVGILYFWTHLSRPLADGTYPKGNYATWTPEGGGVAAAADEGENFVPNEDLQIQPGQGFFVRTIAAGTVIFNNTMRTNGTGQFYFTQPERHRFWLNLESEHNTHNQILIGYVENATLGFDHRIDANIMNYNGNALSSVIEDASTGSATQRLVIQGRPLPFTDTDVVPLGFKAVHSGHFTISIEKVDGLFEEGQKIYIKDGRYGTLHDLTEGGYNFYSPPGEHNERFEIVYATEGEMGIEDIIYNNILIYGYDFTVYIHSQVESIDKVEIYDLLGRKLYQRRLSGAETEARSIEIPTEAFGNQLLLVRAYTQDGKTVVKRVVNR